MLVYGRVQKTERNISSGFSWIDIDHQMCHGQGCRVLLWDGQLIPPLMTESLQWGPINPYGLGLMSLSPILIDRNHTASKSIDA